MRFIAIENEEVTALTEEELDQLEDFQDLNDSTSEALLVENQEADRTMDTIHALECLCETLENKETLTDEDVMRLRTADMFGATGTDAEPGQIVPAVESHSDAAVAMEGIMESIQNGIASLAASSSTTVGLVKHRQFGMKVLVKTLDKRQTKYKQMLKDVQDGKRVSLRINYSAESTKINTFDDLLEQNEKNTTDLESFIGVHNSKISALTSKMNSVFVAMAKQTYGKEMASTFNMFNDEILGAASKDWEKIGGSDPIQIKRSSEFFGSKAIVVGTSTTKMKDEEQRQDARVLVDGLKWSIEGTAINQNTRKMVFDNVSKKDIEKLIAQNDRLIKLLSNYSASVTNQVKNLDNTNKTITGVLVYLGTSALLVKNVNKFIGIITLAASTGSIGAVVASAALPALLVSLSVPSIEKIRRVVLAYFFTSVKLQYRISNYAGFMDSKIINLAIATSMRNYVIVDSYKN